MERPPTRAEENPCVIIHRLSVTKKVRHNQIINTPPRNCQVLHIGCICVLPDAPSEQPEPILIRSSFHIKQPPRNVISWISLLAAESTLPAALTKPLLPTSMATDIGGSHSSNIQETQTNYWGEITIAEDNPYVVILPLSATKPVWHNQETNTPTRNCQVHHIGCICVLLYPPLGQTNPRVLR